MRAHISKNVVNYEKNIIPKIIVNAEENPDWFYPRTKRFLLRIPTAELGFSCFSVRTIINFTEYIVPNRDYSYEGFNVLLNGDNWKIIDGFALSVFNKDKFIAPKPINLIIKPNKVVYNYAINNNTISLTYELIDLIEAAQLKIDIRTNELIRAKIAPLIDMRHVYDNSAPGEHSIKEIGKNYLLINRKNHELKIMLNSNKTSFSKEENSLQWIYKLGDGAREESEKGMIFKSHVKTLYIPGFFEVEDNEIAINVIVSLVNNNLKVRKIYAVSDTELERVFNKFLDVSLGIEYFDNALFGLISTLYTLGIRVKPFNITLPEAGAWWFRSVWIRDLMEVISNNFMALTRLKGEKWIIEVLKTMPLILNKEIGLLPITIIHKNRSPCSYTIDGTLKWIINYLNFLSEYWNPKEALILLDYISSIITAWSDTKNMFTQIDETTGLLKTVACQSWIDTMIHANVDGFVYHVPGRLSRNSIKELRRKREDIEKYLSLPTVLLPEINAMWLKMLDQTLWLTKKLQSEGYRVDNISDILNKLLKNGRKNYIKLFWNNSMNKLNNAVIFEYDIKDTTSSSVNIVAASIVPWIFNRSMLNKIWTMMKNDLLIYRRISLNNKWKPFGIITRTIGSRVFKGDEEYHGYVIWPRDTPYLIELAHILNEKEFIGDVLLNYLDASISESTIFHARELYALPEGKNPYPRETSDNPVPVKNPSQSWSIFIDPYIKFKDIIIERLLSD
ncbi:MAG: amylo-alpha-1,6-glucosidase [Thermoprotei archaeon]|jgi:hypothetical protein